MTATLERPAELTMRYRRQHPEEHSVMLGRAQLGFPIRLPCEEHLVMLAPPRTGKSALLAKVILRYRGPVLSTTTRADLYKHTYRARLRHGGTVHTFNPQGIGGVPSSFAFDVIGGTPEDRGCLDISTAIRRANAFAYAVSSQGMEDGAFWASKTSGYLRAFFYGAAYARSQGYSFGLADVARWALTDRSEQAEDILKDAGAGHWSEEIRQLRGQAQKTAETIRMYLSQCLQFMADPALAAAVSPRPGEAPFDLHGFATSHDTLYMMAQGQDEHAPMAGLFACIASEVHYTAGMVASFNDTRPPSRADAVRARRGMPDRARPAGVMDGGLAAARASRLPLSGTARPSSARSTAPARPGRSSTAPGSWPSCPASPIPRRSGRFRRHADPST